jgi:hypothetical protein
MAQPKTVKEHHDNVRALRCVVTNNPYPTIHHCHGGSMVEAGYSSGGGQRGSGEALVIPLKADFHVGDEGIDYGVGVVTWESWYGTQMDHLREINERLDYDIFELHEAWKKQMAPRGR